MLDVPDQLQIWNAKHSAGNHDVFRGIPSHLAHQLNNRLQPETRILEIGCGNGRDAVYFAQLGHNVTATDFSEQVIEINNAEYTTLTNNLVFEVADIADELPYADKQFDAVHASLAIHYFTDQKTRQIVTMVHNILAIGGLFSFSCKSTDDKHYGFGREIEANVFISSKDHMRHLFSEDYTKQILKDLFTVEYLEKRTEQYSGEESSIIYCIARKK